MSHAKRFSLLNERNMSSESIFLIAEKILELTSKSWRDNDAYIGNPRPYHTLKRQAYHGAIIDDDKRLWAVSREVT